MMQETLEEAISYFKKHTVYGKLFAVMRQKYAIKGELCGAFSLNGLTAEERNVLSGFVGMDLGKDETVKISYKTLEKALEKSRFHMLTWEVILVRHDEKALLSNKEKRAFRDEIRDSFKQKCLALCGKADVRNWLSGLLYEKKSGYRIIEKQMETDRETLTDTLENVIRALEHLPVDEGNRQMLPVYAARITGNPHYFDEGTMACRFLLNYGAWRFGQVQDSVSGIEQRESVLYQLGILKDDLSNFCLAYGVRGIKADGNSHEGLEGFGREKQAVQMTLNTLGSLSQLETFDGDCATVYIIENPAVFSHLVVKYPKQAFLCTAGQLKLASYVAMDLFPEDYIFYYAGDFDPEGLQIAQGLKRRYGERVRLWNYNREYYEQAVSEMTVDASRLKKLDKIDEPELEEIKNCLLRHKKATYQERMLEAYENLHA